MNPFVAGKFRAFDGEGNPLAGGLLYTYKAGSDDPKATYTDFTGNTANANPVVLDANGEASVWLRGTYKMVLKDAQGVQQWSVDNFEQRYNSIENANVVDYGAVGDGITDDTQAFIDALADGNGSVFVPAGSFYLTSEIVLDNYQMLYGAGMTSILQFREDPFDAGNLPTSYNEDTNGVRFIGRGACLKDLLIVGANKAIAMRGDGQECTSNLIDNVHVWDAIIGVCLDGGDDTNYPTYWNSIRNVLVERPRDMGVYLKHDSGGDSPNANYFRNARVYSHGQEMSNDKIGFNIDSGRYGCSFVDCEANLHPGATACIRFGNVTGQNYIVNFTAECLGGAHGIWMDTGAGAGDDGFMTFINYFHATAGSSIFSTEGSSVKRYNAWSAGFPDRFYFGGQARFTDAVFEQINFDSRFYDVAPAADTAPTTNAPMQLLSSFNGAFNFDLEAPGDATGRMYFIKKMDGSENAITIRRADNASSGPDNANFRLVRENDYVVVYCNGSEWSIMATNRVIQQSKFYDTSVTGATLTNLDPDIFFHLISPLSNTTASLLSASDARSVGKTMVIKRNSAGGTTLKVSTIEGETIDLDDQNDYVMVYSNGAGWFIVSERRTF